MGIKFRASYKQGMHVSSSALQKVDLRAPEHHWAQLWKYLTCEIPSTTTGIKNALAKPVAI